VGRIAEDIRIRSFACGNGGIEGFERHTLVVWLSVQIYRIFRVFFIGADEK
jgi:hypothetical protein